MADEVRVITGIPVAANFASGSGSPIIINDATGFAYFLVGSTVTPLSVSGAGTVTSVAGSGGTTGLSFTGTPITTSGTLTLTGTLAVANGGTGITSFAAGIATWLGSATAANLRTAVNGTTGTAGSLVFSSAPTFGTTIGVGSASAAGNGAGVTFPATQSDSSDANTLDDYEEGTWTPTDNSGASLTFSNVNGTYTKIGNRVIASAFLTYPATASGANASITGLPFTAANLLSETQGNLAYHNGTTANKFVALSNTITGSFYTAAGVNVTNVQMTGSGCAIQSVYRI